ncbi:dienelactone hydrolase family protein [Niabella sp. W65]|nr:dienelactone hydrolase family protein [Niabella sp. W65]MCH7366796.1 dienelactone hydrolase family protein [Niabella sp. W65]ULT42503.1 dienelactone hydrolase family protein [Niabella sp. I65]
MHSENIITAGNINGPSKALILLHGRGARAEDILSLADHLNVKEYLLLAPQAANNSWYPQSFIAPIGENQPWLDSALALVDAAVAKAIAKGIAKEHIYFAGFSQGACLTLEYIARNATRYGGAVAFTGGLIGDRIYTDHYKGDFAQTPVFIGTSDPDFHVPVERVHDSATILKSMGADVTERIYPRMGHTINSDEISLANNLVFK